MAYVHEQELVNALINDQRFAFKDRGQYLQQGICPSCGKKELFVSKDKPFVVKCNRLNKCDYSEHTREIYPELFNNFEERFPKTEQNPNATAIAYMQYNRGFDMTKIATWFTQELYQLPDKSRTVPTVRFYIDEQKERFWERLIDVTKEQAKQRNNIGGNRKKIPFDHKDYDDYNGTLYKGEWWTPPGQVIEKGDKVFLVEGIFHAIALHLCGYKVAAIFAAGNFPFLSMRDHFGKQVVWIWSLDDDKAGRGFMTKHHERLINQHKEYSAVALTGTNLDWDDLYRRGLINENFMFNARYRGRMFTARNISEKAWTWHKHTKSYYAVLPFQGALYSIDVNKELTRDLDSEGIEPGTDAAEPYFQRNAKITKIANVVPEFLYCQVAQYTGEISYDFKISFANGSNTTLVSLPGSAVEGPTSFNKALLSKAAGANFTGKPRDFNFLSNTWFSKRIEQVEALSFAGYHKEYGLYIYKDFAYKNGKRFELNEHGFFNIDKHSLKSVSGSIIVEESDDFNCAWIKDYHTVTGNNGMLVLSFWLGSLFAEQIRELYASWPFLEMSGEPGTGKSTVIEFLWRCCGRSNYEGIDPSKSTFAARTRAMMQVSNLPVVLIEGDRDDEKGKRAGFDYDELKTAFNGRAVRSMGVMNRGSETEEPPFRASIVLAQNAPVEASPAMMERIIHVHFTKAHFTPATTALAPKLNQLSTKQLGGFLHRALTLEPQIMETIKKRVPEAEAALLANPHCNNNRLIKNHAQLMAVAMSLPLVFPTMPPYVLEQTIQHIEERCVKRHQDLNADLPLVAKFWETYELLNEVENHQGQQMLGKERLNHASNDNEIAINITHFNQVCAEHRVEQLPSKELKKQLTTSKQFAFVAQNKTVKSKLLNKSIRCWVFNKK